MPSLPIVEHLARLENILGGFLPHRVAPMVHELTLECPKEAFDTGVVSAVAFTAHAGDKDGPIEHALVACCSILTAVVRMVQEPSPWGVRFASAMVWARSARSTVSRWPIAQPITARE